MSFRAPEKQCFLLVVSAGALITALAQPPEPVRRCAPCHNRPGNDQIGEWLDSPYSQVEGGLGCAGCHGGLCRGNGAGPKDRTAAAAARHNPPGAARLTLAAVCAKDRVEAEVVVANLGTGHDLPTGPARRTLVLEVTAHDSAGLPLPAQGVGNVAEPASRVYVKYAPVGSSLTHRSRLAPFESDVSRYRFVSTGRGQAVVRARLVLIPAAGSRLEIAKVTSVCSSSTDQGHTR